MKIKFHTISSKETIKLAETLAENVKNKALILLSGNLGSGKTTFAQGLAKGLSIKEMVNSPTFNIVKIYKSGKLNFHHIDAYRLEGNNKDLGLDEIINASGLTVIEWPEYIEHLLPKNSIKIEIKNDGEDKRTITLEAYGEEEKEILLGVNKKWATNY
jgi:tRNA threonylcarbamoyladenosine biosynthesis protein TsaE